MADPVDPWDSLTPIASPGTPVTPPPSSTPDPWAHLTPVSEPQPNAPTPSPAPPDLPFWQRPPDPSGGFTDAVVRSIPVVGKWPDYAAAAVKSTTDYLSGSGTDWSDLYRKNVEQMREPERQWEAAHPYQSVAADVVGGTVGAPTLGAAARAAGLVPQAGRLISQLAAGAGLGAGGGALNTALDPNETVSGLLGSMVSGGVAGATTALPGLLSAAKAAGLTLKELGELATKVSVPLAGGGMSGHPLIGAAFAAPGAAQALIDLAKVLAQRVPAGLLSLAPAAGAEAGRLGSAVGQLWSSGGS
jgi:hypothetical protein